MGFELKILIVFIVSGVILSLMQYRHKKRCDAADRDFQMVMQSLADKAEREKNNESK